MASTQEFSKAKFLNLHPTGVNQLLGVLDMFPDLMTLHVQLDEVSLISNLFILSFVLFEIV